MDDLSNKSETDSENSLTIFEVRSTDEESTYTNNSSTKSKLSTCHSPSTLQGTPLTPKFDISFARLDEYAFRNKIIESKTTETNKTVGTTNEATIVKPKSVNETVVSKSKINRDEVIIEDWTSDDEDDVCAVKTVSSVKPNVTQAVRSQADKSGQTSQKQGIGFKKVHKIKACFVCKSTGHLIKDYDFYDQKSPEPRVKNVVNTRKRVVKPVWDYGKRTIKIFNVGFVLLGSDPKRNKHDLRMDVGCRLANSTHDMMPLKYISQNLGRVEDSVQLKELMVLVPKLVTRINSLEKELKDTKQTLGNVVLKLVKKVKTLEIALKRKSKKVLISESEGEESEDQGRKFQDIDDDPLVSLVKESMKEKSTDFVTPTKASGEAHEEEISPTILEAAKTLSKVASQGVSKEKSTDKGKRYRRRARSIAKKIDIGLDAKEEINTGREEINTGREEINTGIEEVSTGSTKVDSGTASKRGQREGKAPMVEEDIQATHKTKEQLRQEEAGLEEAIKLQAQLDEEVKKQIHFDKMVAQRMAEEEALTEQQKKRKAQVQFEAQFYTKEDWDTIKAKLEANAELSKDVLGQDLPKQDFAKRMSAQEDSETDKEESVEAMNPTPLTTKSDIYMSFGAMIKDFTREDLIELYRLVMQKYGTNRPEDAYDRVLWSDLRTMFDPPLIEDAIWSLPLQQKMYCTKALATPEQTATGKENLNPLIADSVAKNYKRLSNAPSVKRRQRLKDKVNLVSNEHQQIIIQENLRTETYWIQFLKSPQTKDTEET
ncbi:hypothetical protein Tco_1110427 [Tanacetum coccineum]|uniref:Uncharacterized protein n=1 Tax=Tanacetum coccineum TaxID=301880 RepID=A0ABQ5ILA3_9ASTR